MVQIVFIRHGEKDRTQPSPHLDHKGKLRAKYLADYFLHPYGDFETPNFVFMMKLTKEGKSERCWETMEPTIEKGKLDYELTPRYNTHELANYLSNNCDNDETLIVCWQYSRIVDMINLLGASDVSAWGLSPECGHSDHNCFDATWVVDLDTNTLKLRVYRQFDIVDDKPHYIVPRTQALFEKEYTRTHTCFGPTLCTIM